MRQARNPVLRSSVQPLISGPTNFCKPVMIKERIGDGFQLIWQIGQCANHWDQLHKDAIWQQPLEYTALAGNLMNTSEKFESCLQQEAPCLMR